MKPLFILLAIFFIGCSGATVKDSDIKAPPLTKKQEKVLKQILKTAADIGVSLAVWSVVK